MLKKFLSRLVIAAVIFLVGIVVIQEFIWSANTQGFLILILIVVLISYVAQSFKQSNGDKDKIQKHIDAADKVRQKYPGACCNNCDRRIYGTGPRTGIPIEYCTIGTLTGTDDDGLCKEYRPA